MIRLPFLRSGPPPTPAAQAADRLRQVICDELAPFFQSMGGFDTPMAALLIEIFRQAVMRLEDKHPEVKPLLSLMRRPIAASRDMRRLSDIFETLDGDTRRRILTTANELAAQRLAFNKLSEQMAEEMAGK